VTRSGEVAPRNGERTAARVRTALFTVTVLLAVAACAGGDGPARGPASAPPTGASADVALRASLVQYREDEVKQRLGVRVSNTGSTEVTVETLAVDWAGLAPRPAERTAYPIRPRVDVVLTVPYGEARCSGPQPPADRGVAVALVRTSGIAREVRVELDDDAKPLLRKLYATDCRRQAVAKAVTIGFGARWTDAVVAGTPVLRGSLTIRRGATSAPIDVTDLGGSVLIQAKPVEPARRPLLRMPPGVPTGELPVFVGTSHRCDGHALVEVKKPYDLVVYVALDGQEPAGVTITPPDPALRQRMWRAVLAGCGVS
jgi:hypothetical protein